MRAGRAAGQLYRPASAGHVACAELAGAVVSSVRVILEGASGGVLAVKALGWLVTLTGG